MKSIKGRLEMTGAFLDEREVLSLSKKALQEERFIAKDLQDIALDLLNSARVPGRSSFVSFLVLIGLLAKAVKTLRATVVLVNHGLMTDAEGLHRTLLMTVSVARWICHDSTQSESRAQRYLDMTMLKERAFRNAALRDSEMEVFTSGELGDKFEEMLSKVEGKYTREECEKLTGRDLWGSDEDLCCGSLSSVGYNLGYRRPSVILHARDLLDHVYINKDDDVELKDFATEEQAPGLINMSFVLFLLILEPVSAALQLDVKGKLQSVSERAAKRRKMYEKRAATA